MKNGRASMKRIVNVLDKLNWRKRLCAVFVLCAAATIAIPAQTFATVHSFDGTDGEYPIGVLVQVTNGDLYGTTYEGGANGDGTVFKITPSGTLTTLYSFCSQSGCADGSGPEGGLVQATNGDVYGTTSAGGANGDGTVFKITLGGTLTTLHSFDGTDGAYPEALVQATNGDFYGTASAGGANSGATNCYPYSVAARSSKSRPVAC
jgi:uncharacterized repeat protein (TIGR03803 family)